MKISSDVYSLEIKAYRYWDKRSQLWESILLRTVNF